MHWVMLSGQDRGEAHRLFRTRHQLFVAHPLNGAPGVLFSWFDRSLNTPASQNEPRPRSGRYLAVELVFLRGITQRPQVGFPANTCDFIEVSRPDKGLVLDGVIAERFAGEFLVL